VSDSTNRTSLKFQIGDLRTDHWVIVGASVRLQKSQEIFTVKKRALVLAAALSAASAMAYDGIHLLSSVTFPSSNAGWDYVSYDGANKRVF
jgi:hypothetical protein